MSRHHPNMSMETYYGSVRTTADAIKLFEACRVGTLPRVQRRLSEKERQAIRPGSVFVWDEREAGMRRWTDGKSWSASRVSGSFLTYREMEGKRAGFGGRRNAGRTPDSARASDEDRGSDDHHEGYRYKADGLMKQSFSITTSHGQHLHLISYYARDGRGPANLPDPSSDPALRHVSIPKGIYPESSDRHITPTVFLRTRHRIMLTTLNTSLLLSTTWPPCLFRRPVSPASSSRNRSHIRISTPFKPRIRRRYPNLRHRLTTISIKDNNNHHPLSINSHLTTTKAHPIQVNNPCTTTKARHLLTIISPLHNYHPTLTTPSINRSNRSNTLELHPSTHQSLNN
ncbi:Gluconate transport-inducing protein [Neurospora sp. IMI 360204]|nr:Gluconate transport-inducing protein [Neurospora sp. IMI 360204]